MTRKARRKILRRQVTAMAAVTALGATVAPARALPPEFQHAVAQPRASHTFDIPAGPLAAVIPAFERVTGVRIAVPSDAVLAIHSSGIAGVLGITDALDAMLAGTDLKFRLTGPRSAVLEFRPLSESVSVTAERPGAVVASPKYTEPLRDVPQTITVIPRAVMDEQGTATLRDVLRNVTGITFQAGEGGTPAGDQMTIRGFSARTDMFVDGVRDFGGYSRDTFNLEQVEVAKGPSSAIAGRGSTGGSINLVSKSPNLTAARSVAVEGGSAAHKRVTADVNQPLIGLQSLQGAALRLNAMWTDGGVPGRDIVENRSWGIAPSAALGLGTRTRASLSYLHLQQNNVPDYGLPWVPATNVPLAAYANGRPPVDQSNFYGLTARDYEHIGNDLGTAQVEHDFTPSFSLRSLARYGATRRDSIITPPRFATTTGTAIRRTDVKSRDQNDRIIASQTNVTGHVRAGSTSHSVVAGVELARESSTNYARVETGPQNPTSPDTDLFAPNPNQPYAGAMVRTGAYTDATADSAGVYAFDTAKIGERLELTGGLRWDRFAVDYDSISATGAHAPLSRRDAMVSWRGGVVFKPRPSASLYLGYATAFNPSAEGLALSAATVGLEPEKSRNVEVGTKWDAASGRLSLTAALFRTDKTNARTPGINPGDPPTVLQGRQRVDGVELGASGAVNRRWLLLGSYSLMHSDIAQSNTPAEVDAALALTPKHTLNLWTTYEAWPGLRVGGGAQFMDTVFRNTSNTISVPSYWLANAVVSYDLNRRLTLRLNANNIFDADYVDRVGGGHYIPGPARSLLAGSTIRF